MLHRSAINDVRELFSTLTASSTSMAGLSFNVSSNTSLPNVTHESFLHWLSESNREIRSKMAVNEQSQRFSSGEDGEIGVFAAEKYFNGEVDGLLRRKNADAALMEIEKFSIRLKSPSVMSESSCPSQTALVTSFSGARKTKTKAKPKTRRGNILAAIFRCSCREGNSVDVVDSASEVAVEKKAPPLPDDKTVSFRFQNSKPVYQVGNWMNNENIKILYPRDCDIRVGMNKEKPLPFPAKLKPEEIDGRGSLEVFGSPRKKSLLLPSWDAVAGKPHEETEVSASSGMCFNKDDDSDASSDMIEIESLSGKVISYFARQDSGVASGCVTPATGYAPSETSIDWSVVTASAANISVPSEYDQEIGTPTSVPSPSRLIPRAECGKNVSWKDWSRHRSQQLQMFPPPQPPLLSNHKTANLPSSQLAPPLTVSGNSDPSLIRFRNAHDTRMLYI